MNPYYIGNKQVQNIYFYDVSGIIAEVGIGWISTTDSNRTPVKEIESLPFNRALKKDLTKQRHFFIKSTAEYHMDEGVDLYIYAPNSGMAVEPLGEEIAMTLVDRIHYGEFYNLTATFRSRVSGEWEHKTIKLMKRTYTRSESTTAGNKKGRFIEVLEDHGYKLDSTYKLAERLQDDEFINSMIEVLQS